MLSQFFRGALTAVEWFCNIFMRLVGLFLLVGGFCFLLVESDCAIISEMAIRSGLPWYWGILTIISIIGAGLMLLLTSPRRRTLRS